MAGHLTDAKFIAPQLIESEAGLILTFPDGTRFEGVVYLTDFTVHPDDRIAGIPGHHTMELTAQGAFRAWVPGKAEEAEDPETEEAEDEDPNSWAARLRKRTEGSE